MIYIDEFIFKTLPNFLDSMQKLLEDNGGMYLVGSDVSKVQMESTIQNLLMLDIKHAELVYFCHIFVSS